MSKRYKDELGNKYAYLTVLSFSRYYKEAVYWNCKCDCGVEKEIRGTLLRNGQVKSCGTCDISKVTNPTAPYQKLYRSLSFGAKYRNLEFNISFEEFRKIVDSKCHYCGLDPYEKHYAYSRRRYSQGIDKDIYAVFNGLDRIDSSKGYYSENIVSCCFMCNRMKSDFSSKDFLSKIKEIYLNHEKTGNY